MNERLATIEEIISKALELRHLVAHEQSSRRDEPLARLFQAGNIRSTRDLLQPFAEVARGVRVGFEDGAEIRLYEIQKYDVHLSPPTYTSVTALEVDDIRKSPFLTIEFALEDSSWKNAKSARVSIAGFGTWGLRGEVVLRRYRDSLDDRDYVDTPITHFELGEERSSDHRYVDMRQQLSEDSAEFGRANLLIFLEPRNFRSEIHYFAVDFT